MHIGKVLGDCRVRVTVRDGAKLHLRLLGVWIGQPGIVHSGKLVKLFPGYHERGQIGSVDGKEDHSKHGPDVGHETGGEGTRRVHVYRSLEEYSPDQPICSE